MAGRFKVMQGLIVDDVHVSSSGEITVVLRNEAVRVGPITWPAVEDQLSRELLVYGWMQARTPLTYVHTGEHVVLLDERQLLERAFSD